MVCKKWLSYKVSCLNPPEQPVRNDSAQNGNIETIHPVNCEMENSTDSMQEPSKAPASDRISSYFCYHTNSSKMSLEEEKKKASVFSLSSLDRAFQLEEEVAMMCGWFIKGRKGNSPREEEAYQNRMRKTQAVSGKLRIWLVQPGCSSQQMKCIFLLHYPKP